MKKASRPTSRYPSRHKKKETYREDKERVRVTHAHDPQLDRAMDLLCGIMLFTERAPEREQRVAVKNAE